MRDEVEIVAVGARTPLGLRAESSAAAVRGGLSAYKEYSFVGPTGEPIIAAADARLKPGWEGPDRLVTLARGVLDELEGKLASQAIGGTATELLLVLPEARPGFPDSDATRVEVALRCRFRAIDSTRSLEVVGRGHAGVMLAMQRAIVDCHQRPERAVWILGVDSYLHAQTLLWLERDQRLMEPGVRNGFTPGEGAGGLVVVSRSQRHCLGMPCLAAVRGAHTAREAMLWQSETGSFGLGLSTAVLGATSTLALPEEAIDTPYSDINGERYRSEEWGFALMRTPSVWKSSQYEAPSDCWGDVGAAFGALAGVLAVQSFVRNYARGPRALITGGSDGGLRGAMVLEAPGAL